MVQFFPSGSGLEVVPLAEYASKLAGLHDFLDAHCPSFVSKQKAQKDKVEAELEALRKEREALEGEGDKEDRDQR
jgi:hypothetical protein